MAEHRAAAGRGALARFQMAFTAYVRDPQGSRAPAEIAPERMALYGRLIFGNVERILANMFPVTKRTLPAATWDALARVFLRDHPVRDPRFRNLPEAVVEFLQARGRVDAEPAFLLELAHYEWVDYALSVDETEIDLEGIDPAGDLLAGRPALNPLAWMLRYEYPVHTLRAQAPPAVKPDTPTYLVAVRDPDDRVRYLELNPLSARLLELIDAHGEASGRALIRAVAGELGQRADPTFVAHGAEMLERMREHAVVLGARAARGERPRHEHP